MVQPQMFGTVVPKMGSEDPPRSLKPFLGSTWSKNVHNNAKTLLSFFMVFIFAPMVHEQKWKRTAGELAQICTGTKVY